MVVHLIYKRQVPCGFALLHLSMLLGLVPQSEKVDGLLRKMQASSDRDEPLELLCSAIPLIAEADDTHVFKLFVDKVGAILRLEKKLHFLGRPGLFCHTLFQRDLC